MPHRGMAGCPSLCLLSVYVALCGLYTWETESVPFASTSGHGVGGDQQVRVNMVQVCPPASRSWKPVCGVCIESPMCHMGHVPQDLACKFGGHRLLRLNDFVGLCNLGDRRWRVVGRGTPLSVPWCVCCAVRWRPGRVDRAQVSCPAVVQTDLGRDPYIVRACCNQNACAVVFVRVMCGMVCGLCWAGGLGCNSRCQPVAGEVWFCVQSSYPAVCGCVLLSCWLVPDYAHSGAEHRRGPYALKYELKCLAMRSSLFLQRGRADAHRLLRPLSSLVGLSTKPHGTLNPKANYLATCQWPQVTSISLQFAIKHIRAKLLLYGQLFHPHPLPDSTPCKNVFPLLVPVQPALWKDLDILQENQLQSCGEVERPYVPKWAPGLSQQVHSQCLRPASSQEQQRNHKKTHRASPVRFGICCPGSPLFQPACTEHSRLQPTAVAGRKDSSSWPCRRCNRQQPVQ
jgi:hypothetical protein